MLKIDRSKVVIVGHSYLAEENQKNLAVLSKKVDLEVISPNTSEGMIFNYNVKQETITGDNWVIRLYDKWVPPKFPSAVYFLKSWHLGLKRFKPDIIHIEADPFTPLFVQVYTLSKILVPQAKIICTVKQNTYTSRNRVVDFIKDTIAKYFVHKVDHFITVNSGVAKIYRKRFHADPSKITYCTQLGVDTEVFSPVNSAEKDYFRRNLGLVRGDVLIGYAGRLVDYKGVPDLIETIRLLRLRTKLDVKLALLGMGPMYDYLRAKREEYLWMQLVGVLPHVRVSEFLKSLDLFVMPSRALPDHEEHDAHALLEAMAVGIPCIATTSGANKDVLEGAGILVKPGDKTELAKAMIELISNNGLRTTYGQLGRKQVVKKYSLKSVAEKYLSVYNNTLKFNI